METIRIFVMVSIVFLFFQQGNDTHTFLHIIDNIELKLDFVNLKLQIKSVIVISVKKNPNSTFSPNRTALIDNQ